MSKLFYPKQLSIWSQAFSLFQMKKMIAVLLLTWAAMQQADAQCLDLTKTLIGVAPASSGIVGNIDVTYHSVSYTHLRTIFNNQRNGIGIDRSCRRPIDRYW